jgi:peptide/nickel transport system permease protein
MNDNKIKGQLLSKEKRRILRVLISRKIVVFGIIVILIFVLSAIFAPILAPYDPYEQNLQQTLQQPGANHWLGTDAIGRDTFSRIIYGSRTSLIIGFVAIFMASIIGMFLGLIAGYFGGKIYTIFMRFIDAMMCFPPILMALVIAGLMGSGLKNITVAIGIALIPAYARLMCAQVLSIKQNDFILAARVSGASNLRIMLHRIVPNCFPPLIVLITMNIGIAILSEASLSYLGLGIEAPGAAWGSMVNDGYLYLLTHPLLSFAPGLAIMLVVFAFNMVGDGLRDALDPKLRGTV